MGFSSSRLGEVSYSLVVSRGYVRLVRQGKRLPRTRMPTHFAHRDGEWMEVEPDRSPPYGETCAPAGEEVNPDPLDPQVQEAIDEAMHPRRGDGGQSARSRMNMRRMFVSLPWELVGPRPALISLTYPGNWQPWVPDGRTWEAHRRAFERRWVRRWGEPLVGVWVKEFQESGRPHLHLYVGLPSAMSDDDFAGLRERTLPATAWRANMAATRAASAPRLSGSASASSSGPGCATRGRRSSAPRETAGNSRRSATAAAISCAAWTWR